MSKFRHLRTAALLIASLFFVALNAQQKISVGGTIVDADSQEPLIGVTVIEKGTANGVATDFDGNFTIKVAPKATLQLSYVGYKPLEVKVDGNNKLNIAMTTASTIAISFFIISSSKNVFHVMDHALTSFILTNVKTKVNSIV